MLLRLFSVVFPCIRKKLIRSDDEICQLYINQSINPVFTLRMVAYYGKTNKNELSKDTTKDTHFWLTFRVHSAYSRKLDCVRWRTREKKFLSHPEYKCNEKIMSDTFENHRQWLFFEALCLLKNKIKSLWNLRKQVREFSSLYLGIDCFFLILFVLYIC